MERKAHNYTLVYKKWTFKIDESDNWNYYVLMFYDDRGSIFINPNTETLEETKERVENLIKTELK